MDFQLTPDLILLRKVVRDFAGQEIAPLVPLMESTGETPLELYKKMGDQGFMGVTVPVESGGTGMGHLARMILVEEVGRVSAAVAMALQCLHIAAGSILNYGSDHLKDKYVGRLAAGSLLSTAAVTEAGGGSDPSGITTAALEQEDHYLLNGRKVFITNSHICDISLVLAKTKDEPRKEFSMFVLEKDSPGFRPGRAENKIGFHGSVTGELVMQNCRVPGENLLGEKGKGLAIALKGIGEYGRTGIVGVALGIIQASLEAALKFAGERVLYGKPISNLPSIHFRIAEIHAELEACRLMAYRTAWLLDQHKATDTDIATTKFFVTEAALRCTRKAMDIHGGYGCMKEYPVERYLRDAQLLIPSDGTNDIMRVIVGRSLTAPKKN